jgi:hypothetical protein
VGELATQVGTTATSVLALLLSLLNLYLHRRDRRPRLRIRARYEYRIEASGEEPDKDSPPPRILDDSQEGLYLLLGDFLREYALDYPQGSPLVRFAVSNEGERAIYLESVKLILRTNPPLFGDRPVSSPLSWSIDWTKKRFSATTWSSSGSRLTRLISRQNSGQSARSSRLSSQSAREDTRVIASIAPSLPAAPGSAYKPTLILG